MPSRWDEPAPASESSTPAQPQAPTPNAAAAAQAAAIAAKIAASLRPGVQGNELIKKHNEDEGFVKDIEINDLRNRYLLTKGPTQKKIEEETGATVTTKGVWVPDRTKLAPGETPLYIHVTAKSSVVLNNAVAKVQELIDQDLGPLIDDRTLIARNRAMGLPPPQNLQQENSRRVKWPEEKLFIGLESMRNFNIRAKVVGPGGMFVKYIQAETGSRVQIKGIGSGFMESETGREAEEPMHVSIAAPTPEQVTRGKNLAEDLLAVLRIEHGKARDTMGGGGQGGVYQPGHGTYAPPGGQQQQDQYGGYYQQQQQQQQYQQGQGQDGTPSQAGATPTGAGGATPAQGSEAWAQYAAYWAAYGYDVNDPQFQAWQATQYPQGGAGQAPAAA